MLAWDIIKFFKQYGEPDIRIGDVSQCFDFFFDIINKGQVVLIQDGKGLAAAAVYYKVRRLDEIRRKRGTFQRMRNLSHGHIVYVHTLVIRPDWRRKGTIWKLIKQIRDKELLCDTVAFTFNKNEKWTYKIERRREKMRDNCGIIALDALLKSLNLNMNRISLDTLSKICRDNGRLMFPLKVPSKKLASLQFPYILQTNNHYEVIEDETALDGIVLEEDAYLLHPTLSTTTIPHVIDEEEAKAVKGAGGGGVKNIPIIGPYLSKPARLVPLAVSAGGQMLGIPAPLTMAMSTAAGAGQGLTTGLWGEPGAGSMLSGGLQGFGQGMIGRGVGSGLSNVFTPARTISAPGATISIPNQGFFSGFKQGFGESVPFKNAINSLLGKQFFTGMDSPGVKDITGAAASILGGGGQPPVTGAATTGGLAASPAAGAAPGSAAAVTQQASTLKNLIPSAALMLAGNLIPQPAYDVPSTVDVYKQMIASGQIPTTAGPLGQAAEAATLKNINSPDAILTQYSEPYKQAIIADLQQREAEEIAQVRTIHAQNGTSGGSDEMRDINRVQEKYRNYQGQQLGAIEENLYNQKVNIYLDSIAKAYGMDQANLQTIAGLTGASIYEASVKYGIKAQQVKDFRDAIYALAQSAAPGAQQTTAANLLGRILKA